MDIRKLEERGQSLFMTFMMDPSPDKEMCEFDVYESHQGYQVCFNVTADDEIYASWVDPCVGQHEWVWPMDMRLLDMLKGLRDSVEVAAVSEICYATETGRGEWLFWSGDHSQNEHAVDNVSFSGGEKESFTADVSYTTLDHAGKKEENVARVRVSFIPVIEVLESVKAQQ